MLGESPFFFFNELELVEGGKAAGQQSRGPVRQRGHRFPRTIESQLRQAIQYAIEQELPG
jgi:hypothetical protein